jgi:hypothetical protein
MATNAQKNFIRRAGSASNETEQETSVPSFGDCRASDP